MSRGKFQKCEKCDTQKFFNEHKYGCTCQCHKCYDCDECKTNAQKDDSGKFCPRCRHRNCGKRMVF